jgi:GT2 family glycosyltransferase
LEKKVAILITCHNRRQKTIDCLNALHQAYVIDNLIFKVYLVDDGSTDGTGEAVKKNFPEVQIILGSGDLYWNRGMHLAWQTAALDKKHDYFLWLNDDVILYKNVFEIIYNDSKDKPDSIICGSMQSSYGGEVSYGGKKVYGKLIKPNGKPQKITLFNGNFVLIPQSVYTQIGMVDPIFPHAIGDYDYSLRALKNGIESYIASEFCGICKINEKLPAWCTPKTPILKRIKSLYSPLGSAHPYYFFLYERRNYGLTRAIKHLITIHLRLIFPSLWKSRDSFFK